MSNETQQVYSLLMQIDKLLADIEVKITKIQNDAPKTRDATMTVREGIRLLTRFNHLLAHLGLPEEINGAIRQLQQLVFMLRMAQMSLNFLAMGTPYGFAMGVLGAGSIAASIGAMTEPMMAMGE